MGKGNRFFGIIVYGILSAAALTGGAQNVDFEDLAPIERESGSALKAKIMVGFDPSTPYRRESTWIPVTVEIQNGREAIEGELTVRLKDGRETYTVTVNQAPGTLKTYSLFVYVPRNLDELQFTIESPSEVIPLGAVTVTSGLESNSLYAAVLSDETGSHDHLLATLETDPTSVLDIIYTQPRLLSRAWVGYKNIDALVWDNAPSFSLSPLQAKALEEWIQMGGTLVLCAGSAWQALDDSAFQLYVPVAMQGSKTLPSGVEWTSPVDGSSGTLRTSQVAATGKLLEPDALKVWLKAGETPLLVEKSWGAGRILWLATSWQSPLLQERVSETALIKQVFKPATSNSNVAISQIDSVTNTFLRWMVQAELPSTLFIALYLGVYILIVVPVNYFVFRAFQRLEWAWLTVPIWALIFAYGAYYIGALRQQGHIAVEEISVLEAANNANVGQTTTYASIYSPVRRWYTLLFNQPPAYPMRPELLAVRPGANVAVEESLTINFDSLEEIRVKDYLIYHWSQRILKTQHSHPIGDGMHIEFTFENEQGKGRFENNTGYRLRDPVVVVSEKRLQLEDIENGEVLEIIRHVNEMERFNLLEVLNRMQSRFGWGRMPRRRGGNERNASQLMNDYLTWAYPAHLMQQQTLQGQGIFMARIEKPMLDFNIQGATVDPSGQTLLSVIFPYQRTFEGRITLPSEAWRVVSLNTTTGGFGYRNSFGRGEAIQVSSLMPGQWNMVSQIPLSGAEARNLYIRVNYQAIRFHQASNNPRRSQTGRYPELVDMSQSAPVNLQHEIHVKNQATGNFEPLSQIAYQNGALRSPDDYVDFRQGVVVMQINPVEGHTLYIPAEAIQIHMTAEFSLDKVKTVLDIPLNDLVFTGEE